MNKTVNVFLKTNGGYTIVKDSETIIDTEENPLKTYHEVIDTLFNGLEINIVNNNGGDIKAKKEKFESAINGRNNVEPSETFDPWKTDNNTGKYKETFENNVFENDNETVEISDDDHLNENDSPVTKEPVGSIEKPTMGDIIYIDGISQTLSKITGGLATVLSVKETNDPVVTNIEYSVTNEWGDEESLEETENNILVELEEFPGTFISWTMLKEKQDELKTKYGYTTAKKMSMFS